jgi:hypothetical protein
VCRFFLLLRWRNSYHRDSDTACYYGTLVEAAVYTMASLKPKIVEEGSDDDVSCGQPNSADPDDDVPLIVSLSPVL